MTRVVLLLLESATWQKDTVEPKIPINNQNCQKIEKSFFKKGGILLEFEFLKYEFEKEF